MGSIPPPRFPIPAELSVRLDAGARTLAELDPALASWARAARRLRVAASVLAGFSLAAAALFAWLAREGT